MTKHTDTQGAGGAAAPRVITHEEALEAALALIDHYFGNTHNGRRVQTSIPLRHNDTDHVLVSYIMQQRIAASQTPAAPPEPRWRCDDCWWKNCAVEHCECRCHKSLPRTGYRSDRPVDGPTCKTCGATITGDKCLSCGEPSPAGE